MVISSLPSVSVEGSLRYFRVCMMKLIAIVKVVFTESSFISIMFTLVDIFDNFFRVGGLSMEDWRRV